MSRLAARRQTRSQGRHIFSTLSIAFFAFVALLAVCPSSVSAEEQHPEYGTVIGIGASFPLVSLQIRCLSITLRFGNNVSSDYFLFAKICCLTPMCWHIVIHVLGEFCAKFLFAHLPESTLSVFNEGALSKSSPTTKVTG